MRNNLPTIEITDDLKIEIEIEKINEKLRNSNRFTDESGILIGSNWVNWKKEKAPCGEKFKCVFFIDGNQEEAIAKYNLYRNLDDELDLEWDIEPEWIQQTVHNPENHIIYWKTNDNDSPKNTQTPQP